MSRVPYENSDVNVPTSRWHFVNGTLMYLMGCYGQVDDSHRSVHSHDYLQFLLQVNGIN